MATKQKKGRAPRKKGEWKLIAQGRSHARNRVLVTNPGAFQMPRVGDVGSAAYRRRHPSASADGIANL